MIVSDIAKKEEWNDFIMNQPYRPFLQSWQMGQVYHEVNQYTKRFVVRKESSILAVCSTQCINARRGRHISIPYGPIIDHTLSQQEQKEVYELLMKSIQQYGKEERCRMVRMSPFWNDEDTIIDKEKTWKSPLHLLAEHIWYIPLRKQNPWQAPYTESEQRTKEDILASMRKTTRNLIRRAEKEGVVIQKAENPREALETYFIPLHDETRKRHHFTPYTNDFFRSQVNIFSEEENQVSVYYAQYNNRVIASSIHIHFGGETSYHHGASSSEYSKIPASYLLQWNAIEDSIDRQDAVYNFWGIAPENAKRNHPFSGVTLFKTGFGGEILNLSPCVDIPLNPTYITTYLFEHMRKWYRGF